MTAHAEAIRAVIASLTEHITKELRPGNPMLRFWRGMLQDGLASASQPSEAPAAPTRETWRTIETAPKDGTPVLGFERSERGPQVMRYSGVCWSSVPGGYSCHPTHWMALPSPPAPEKEQQP